MRNVRTLTAATAVLSVFACSEFAFAADPQVIPPLNESARLQEIVVSGSRVPTPREDEGRAIEVRSQEEFAERQTSSLTDTLQSVSGVRAQNLGGPGSPGTTPIEIRGFRSSGTQLLFNGLRLNDPSSISGIAESFFPYLTSNDLQSVEVLKGANGTLYGSDAQAGSINLLSEKPKDGVNSEFTFRGGSFNTFEEIAKLNVGASDMGTPDMGLLTTVTRLDSEGLNKDGNYENTTVSSIGSVKVSEALTLTPMFRMVSGMNDLDTSPTLNPEEIFVPNLPTPSNQVHLQSYFYGLSTDYKPCDGFNSKLSLYANTSDRTYYFDFGSGPSISDFRGDSYNLDWQNSLEVDALNSVLISGAEVEHQNYSTVSDDLGDNGSQDRYAVYIKDRLSFLENSLLINLGGRVTHVSAIDRTLPSFETSAVYKINETSSRLHSSLTQGFRSPSLFELQGRIVDFTNGQLVTVGNRGLKPEESLSFDFGVTQKVSDIIEADVTFFNLASEQTIVFDFGGQRQYNGGGGENQGLEYSLTVTPREWWKLRGAYTYLSKSDVDGNRLQRRPYNIATVTSSLRLGVATLFSELRYRSSADIEFYGFNNRYREGGYTVFDTALTVPVGEASELFVRGNNLFDIDYTDSGYRMPGISFFGGFKVKIG